MVVLPVSKREYATFQMGRSDRPVEKTVMAFSGERVYIMQRDDPMSTPIPRLASYEGVEVMIVARPLRGEEGMGAATVGKGHRNTTYTGYRGPEAPKGKGRRRERDCERVLAFQARELDPMHHTVYTESAALNPKLGIQLV